MSEAQIDPRLVTAACKAVPLVEWIADEPEYMEEAIGGALRAARDVGADAVLTDGTLVVRRWRRACPDHTIDQGYDPAGPAPRCGRCEVRLVPLESVGT